MESFWIKIRNWDKHNPRKDIKEPKWFAFSNKMIEDEDFFDFTHAEFKVMIYLFSKASQKRSAVIRVSPKHAKQVCNISHEDLASAVEKLSGEDLMIVVHPTREEIDLAIAAPRTDAESTRTESVRAANTKDKKPNATEEDSGEHDSTQESRGIVSAVIPELASCPEHVTKILVYVPWQVQRVWVETWELEKFKKVLSKIVMKNMGTIRDPQKWASIISSWSWSEKPSIPFIKKFSPSSGCEIEKDPDYAFAEFEEKLREFNLWELVQSNNKQKKIS